jgi:exopolysaccharide biosynthesis polyprenyl glycosylphosphotransferase
MTQGPTLGTERARAARMRRARADVTRRRGDSALSEVAVTTSSSTPVTPLRPKTGIGAPAGPDGAAVGDAEPAFTGAPVTPFRELGGVFPAPAETAASRAGRLFREPFELISRVSPSVRLLVDIVAIVLAESVFMRLAALPVLLIFLPTLALFRLYSPQQGVARSSLVGDLPRLVGAAGVATLAMTVLFPTIYTRVNRYNLWLLLLAAAYSFVGLVIGRALLNMLSHMLRTRGIGLDPTLIVGRGHTVEALRRKIAAHPEHGLRVVGVLANAHSEEDQIVGARPEDLPAIIERYGVRQLILVPEDDEPDYLTNCFMAVDGLNVKASLVPPLQDFLLSPAGVEHIEGVPLISLGRLSYAPRMMPGKRLMDVAGAIAALTILSPLFLVVAAAIKLTDGGPVFFRQSRAGYKGRTFKMLKFRSMCVDAEARLAELTDQNETDGLLFKMKDDPRITRVGRIIRKTSIDELPQFINVLKGDMSLVGPRPLPVEAEHFGDIAIKRLNVRPGCTGFWQILGRSDLSYEEMVKLDLAYIQNWSLWADVQIILKTVPILFTGRGAY